MDRVDRVPVNFVRRLQVGFRPDADADSLMPAGQLLTGDQNLVNIQAAIDYSVGADDEVVAYVIHRDRIEPAISRAAEAVLAEWVAGHTIDEVLLTGKVALRDYLVPRVQDRIKPYDLGIKIQAASITWLAAPDEVKPEFERVAIKQSEIRTLENNARQDAERLKRQALAEADQAHQLADAYAEGRKRLAQAEAEAFLARVEQYHRLRKDNPNILTAIWWSEMGQVFANLKANGQVDLLDDRLGGNGLDIMQFARPKKK